MSAQIPSARKTSRRLIAADQSGLNLVVVVVLGLVSVVCVVGVISLSIDGKPTPEFLVAVGSGAVGGLVGLLVQTPKKQ